jgi:hypothetical protein
MPRYTTPALVTATVLATPLFIGCAVDDQGQAHVGPETYQTSLLRYSSCNDLERDLKNMYIAELETQFELIQDYRGGGHAETDASGPPAASDDARTEGEDFSGTNNQEDGVDEADFVKTDGYHVYVVNGNALHIFGVPEFGDLEPLSEFAVEGYPQQMLVHRDSDKVVVFSQIYPYMLPEDHPLREAVGDVLESGYYWRVPTISKATVIDVSDREQPALHREVFIEGTYQTARLIDSSVRMGSFSYNAVPGLFDWWWYYQDSGYERERAFRRARAAILAAELGDLVPRFYERTADGGFEARALTQGDCATFHRPENSHGRGFTSLLSLDLLGDDLEIDAEHVVSNWPTIYASRDYLYIAEPAHDWWWFWWNDDHSEMLNLHMFDIREPGKSSYLASGRVNGVLINQFSLGEHEGYLRVATTQNFWGRWWLADAPPSDNHVYVLERAGGELRTVGHIGGIAEGERIWAARFVGDKGYLVTFEDIDPLFTLDLSKPSDPRIIGELKIEGVSTYIHPIENDRLLTIGISGDANGLTWQTEVNMFDVSDFADPKLTTSLPVSQGQGWGWSEALWEHKAFQYWAPEKLLAVPASSWNYDNGHYEFISRLELVKVDPESAQGEGLSSYGHVDHSHLFETDDEYFWYRLDVRRSLFMGDYLYAISDRGITVHELAGLAQVGEARLPGPRFDFFWR